MTWEQYQSKTNGKIRTKLAEMLSEELGTTVNPDNIIMQHPHYVKYYDCCRWYGNCDKIFEDGTVMSIGFSSWNTMTDIVKNGAIIARDGNCTFEIHARGK